MRLRCRQLFLFESRKRAPYPPLQIAEEKVRRLGRLGANMDSFVRPNQWVAVRLSSDMYKLVKATPNT